MLVAVSLTRRGDTPRFFLFRPSSTLQMMPTDCELSGLLPRSGHGMTTVVHSDTHCRFPVHGDTENSEADVRHTV